MGRVSMWMRPVAATPGPPAAELLWTKLRGAIDEGRVDDVALLLDELYSECPPAAVTEIVRRLIDYVRRTA